MTPPSFNFADLLSVVAEEVPARTALICGERRLSYRELDTRVTALARYLHAIGVRRGEHVGIQLRNAIEYIETFFAACRIGATPVNVNYRYVADELSFLYRSLRLDTIVCTLASEGAVSQAAEAACVVKRRVVVGGEEGAQRVGVWRYEDAFADDACEDLPTRSDDDLVMICTGGTTGLPKGVVWTHKDIFFAALGGGGYYHKAGAITEPRELSSRALESSPLVNFPLAPLMHGAALWSALASFFAGHTVVLCESVSFDVEQLLDIGERREVNLITIVGDAMALPIADALERHPGRWKLRKLYAIGSGGALFSDHLQKRIKSLLPHVSLMNSMGSTEGGAMGPGARPAGGGYIRMPPHPSLAVVVVEQMRLAIAGEQGVLARSGFLPRCYFGDQKKSAETFVEIAGRRYALTGDAAMLDADGSITVMGRGSSCINTGGEKVFPEEVEEVLRAHPQVLDALVVGLPDSRWGERVTALVALRPEAALEADALRNHCRAALASYKVPKDIAFLPAIQRSPAGKADYAWARRTLIEAL